MTTPRWLLPVLGLIALGACTNEKIVFKTRAPFNAPRDSINGFLGYYTVSTKQTTCGNCHVDQQGTWIGTRHAQAWSCNNCHSVNQLGNAVPDTTKAGYAKVADSTYFDVQCESCHGPGFTHVQGPNPGNVPLASIKINPDTTVARSSATCAACHTGVHSPFVEEWSQSPHASVVPDPVNAGGSCLSCHEGRSVLKAWGVNTNYVEKN